MTSVFATLLNFCIVPNIFTFISRSVFSQLSYFIFGVGYYYVTHIGIVGKFFVFNCVNFHLIFYL